MNTVLRLAPLAVSLSAAVSSYAHSPPQFSAARSLASDKCTCTLVPQGHGQDDAPAIASILSLCGQNGSTVCFPDPYVYTIGSALETYVDNATILLEGTFQFSPNITYWANNRYGLMICGLRRDYSYGQAPLPALPLNFKTKSLRGASMDKTSYSMVERASLDELMVTVKFGIHTRQVDRILQVRAIHRLDQIRHN